MNMRKLHTNTITAPGGNAVSSKFVTKSFNIIDLLVILVGFSLYFYVARIWQPTYMVKSAAKAFAFVILPFLASYLLQHEITWLKLSIDKDVFKKILIKALLFAIACIIFALFASEVISNFFDVTSIVSEVKSRTNASRQLVLASLLYISVVNSLMEEVYFRGFVLVRLQSRFSNRIASWISALFFAAYHLITFRNWFSPSLLILTLSALTLGGLILNYFTLKYRSLLPVWLIHALMNITIFTVIIPFI